MAEKINFCPVCKGGKFSDYLKVKDHFLSKETFNILQCISCGFRFVNPRPDKNEIGGYYQSEEYISHGVVKTDLLSRVYRIARIFSIRNKYRIVKKYCQSGRILDIGCGTGEFLAYCRKMGFEVSGVEPNEKARHFAGMENGITVSGKLKPSGDNGGIFNCITMWHVLEHVHELDQTLDTIKELLTPDGTFIAAVPNSNSWDALHYGSSWAAYDVPRHLYHFTESTMTELAKRNGFEVVKTWPQKLDAYYVSMLSEKYAKGKKNYLKSVILGFWSNFNAKTGGKGHSSLIFILSLKKGQF
ncbi:MAG: class I SAM-dependent methyltransferase [Bacteroidota bacterium]